MASAEKKQEMDVAAGMHLIDAFLTDIVQQVKRDVGHMMKLVQQWDLQECATSSDREDESRLGPVTIQKVDEYLDCFFARRALVAEDCRELPTSEEDPQLEQSILPTTAELVAAIRVIIPAMLNMIQGAPGRPEVETATQDVAGSLSDIFEETDHISVAVPVNVRDEVDDDSVPEYVTKSQVASKAPSSISPTQITQAEILEKDLGISSSISDETLRTAVESEMDTSGPVRRQIYLETCKDISPALLDYGEDQEENLNRTTLIPIHSIKSPHDMGIQIPLDLKPTSPEINVSTPTIFIRDLSSLADIRKAVITTEEADTDHYPFEDPSLTESSSGKDAMIASPSSFHIIQSQMDDKTYVFQVPVIMEIPDNVDRARSPAEDIGSVSSVVSEMSWGKDSDSSLSQSITSQESGRTAFISFPAPTTVEIPEDSSSDTPLILDAMSLFSASPDNRVILEGTDGVEALTTASGTILILSKEALDENVTVLSPIPSTEHQYMIESPSPPSIPSSSVIINVPISNISQAMVKDAPSTTAGSVRVPTPEANTLITDVGQIVKGSPITLVMSEDGRDDKILEARSFSGSPTDSDFLPSPPTTIIQTIQNIPLCITTALQNGVLSFADGTLAAEMTQGHFADTENRRLLSAEPEDVSDKEVPGTGVLTSLSFTSMDSRTTSSPPLAIITPSLITDSISTSIAPTFPESDLSVAAERRVVMPEDEASQTRPSTPATLPDATPTTTGEVLYVSAENLMKLLVGPQHPSENVTLPFLLEQSRAAEALKDTSTAVLDERHFGEEETTPSPVPTTAPVYINLSPSSMSDGIPLPSIVYDSIASILEAKDILPTTPRDSCSVPSAPAEAQPHISEKMSFPIVTIKQQEGRDALPTDSPVGITTAVPDDILSSLSLYVLDKVSAQDMGPSPVPTSAAATDDTLPSTSTEVKNLVESFSTEILDHFPMVSKDTCAIPLDVLKECLDVVSSSQSVGLQDSEIATTIASLSHTDAVPTDGTLSVITTAMLGKVLDVVAENRLQTFNIELAKHDSSVTESPGDIQSELETIEKDQSSTVFSFQDGRILAHVPTSSSTPQLDDTQLGITQAMLDSLLVADTKESAEMSTLMVADRPALTPLLALALNAQAITCADPLTTNVTHDNLNLGHIFSAVSRETGLTTTSDFIRELSVPMTSPMLDRITNVAEELRVTTLFPNEDLETSAYSQIIFPVPLSSDPSVLQDSRTMPFTALSPSAKAILVDKLPAFIPAMSDDPKTKPAEHLRVIHPSFANISFDRYKPGISSYVPESVRKDATEKMPYSSRKSPTEKSKKGVFSVFSSGLKSVKEKLRMSSTTLEISRDKVAETGLCSTICKTSTCVPSSCFNVCKEKCCMSSSVSESSIDEDSETKLSSYNSTKSETGRKICSELSFLPSTETTNDDNIIDFAQALLNGFIKVDLEEKKSTPQVGEVSSDALKQSCSMGPAMSESVKFINSSDSRSSSIQNYESHCRSISPVKPSSSTSALPDSTLPVSTPPALDGDLADAKIDLTDSTPEVDSCSGTFQELCFPAVPKDLALTEGTGTALRDQKIIASQDCSAPSTTANSKVPGFTQTLSVRVSLRSLCSRSDKK